MDLNFVRIILLLAPPTINHFPIDSSRGEQFCAASQSIDERANNERNDFMGSSTCVLHVQSCAVVATSQ